MKKVFERTESLTDAWTIYCSGCGHGVAHRLVAEVIDELNMREKTIGVAPVGCAVYAYDYFNFDMTEAPHGRTPCVAGAIKRIHPENLVLSYQGDGDLASIGMGEIIHSANRGDNITVIFINNANYGMTGGQMAPTTLLGQKTTTTISGRDSKLAGFPIRVCELLSSLDGAKYIARAAIIDPANIIKAKKYIKKAFQVQIENKGFSLVELLCSCPVNWGLTPVVALDWIKENMIPVYPLGEIKC